MQSPNAIARWHTSEDARWGTLLHCPISNRHINVRQLNALIADAPCTVDSSTRLRHLAPSCGAGHLRHERDGGFKMREIYRDSCVPLLFRECSAEGKPRGERCRASRVVDQVIVDSY